jgi:methionine biosynthesis protein MetW
MRDVPRRSIRPDLQLIAEIVSPGARVLDVGCGDGALLDYLVHEKAVDGRGIELSSAGVNACVSAGLPVIQGNAETDLFDYPADAFDFVILSQTLQAMLAPRTVLQQLLRIGRRAIVSFPNVAHWRLRWTFLVDGTMPSSVVLPNPWYETPNIHLCSIRDFLALCRTEAIVIERGICLDSSGIRARWDIAGRWANLFGEQAVFLLKR